MAITPPELFKQVLRLEMSIAVCDPGWRQSEADAHAVLVPGHEIAQEEVFKNARGCRWAVLGPAGEFGGREGRASSSEDCEDVQTGWRRDRIEAGYRLRVHQISVADIRLRVEAARCWCVDDR
jgi:hypothetical protein